jgi:1,4-dihydroxy-2-naphthoate octaprenyltransferase
VGALNKLQAGFLLLKAGRLHFLLAGFLLYLIGALFALRTGAPLSVSSFLFGYLVCGSAHLSVSYSNDYFDRFSDEPKSTTRFSGGSGVLPVNPHLAGAVLMTAVTLSLVSLVSTVLLVLFGGIPVFLILFVAAGLALGWGYSAPPFRLSARGLGEPATMAAFGIFLPGSGYLFSANPPGPEVLLLLLPLFFLGLFFIVSVELPDYPNDLSSGKRTLVVRAGPVRALIIGTCGAAVAAAAFLVLAVLGAGPGQFFAAAAVASAVPLLAGLLGIRSGDWQFSRAKNITGTNIGALILFSVLAVASLLVMS